jgi:hypothetical protein
MKKKRTFQVSPAEAACALAFQELAKLRPGEKIDGYSVAAHTKLPLAVVNAAIAGLMDKGIIQRTSKTQRQ